MTKTTSTTTPTTTHTTTILVATVEAAEAVRNAVSPAGDARLPKEAPNIESAVNLSQPDVQPAKMQGSSKCAIPATEEKKIGYAENTEITENQELTHNVGVQTAPKPAEYDCLAKRIDKKIDKALDKKIDKKIDRALDKKIDKKIDKALDKKIDRALDKKIDRALDKKIDRALDKKIDRALDKKIDKKIDRALDEKIDKKIDKALDFKCVWKKATKTLRKRMGRVVVSILLVFSSSLGGDSKSFDSPKNRQTYAISATQYCPTLDSASPVAVTPSQSASKTGNTHMQVNQACYVAQQ